MNGIKFLMALAAVFVLIIPAFSMPYNGMGQDDKQKICDCQKPMMGQDDKQKDTCFGQDGKQKTCDCIMSCMGKDDKQKNCDCQKPCDCQKSMMGDDDKQALQGQDNKLNWQGKDDKQKSCDCQKPMMGQDGKQMNHKNVKSMMGDRKENSNSGVKIVIINLKV